MKNTCIGCKRDISWGQKDCPFCGASQSFIRHYLTSVIVFLALLSVSGWAGYAFYEKSVAQAELTIAQQQTTQLDQANHEVGRLKAQLAEADSKLKEASQAITDAEKQKSNKSSEAQALTSNLQKKLADAEKRAKDQAGRAGWLSRENTRLKADLKTLQEKLALLEQPTGTNNITSQNSPSPSEQQPTNSGDPKDPKIEDSP